MTNISLEMFAKVPRASLSMDNFATMFNLSCKQTNGEYVQNLKVYISYILEAEIWPFLQGTPIHTLRMKTVHVYTIA